MIEIASHGATRTLPWGVAPPIQTYPDDAFSLSILSSGAGYAPLLFSHYAQIALPRLEFLGDESVARALLCQRISYEKWAKLGWLELVNRKCADISQFDSFAIESMEAGYYLILDLDEYHVPGCAHFEQQHTASSHCILGYDPQALTFDVAGNRDGRYSVEAVSINTIRLAMESVAEMSEEKDTHSEWIRLARLGRQTKSSFDASVFREGLDGYIASREIGDDESVHGKANKPAPQCVWGSDVYGLYIEWFERLASLRNRVFGLVAGRNRALDLRFTRVLWEHKRIMLDRLSFLERSQILDTDDALAARYAPIEQYARDVRDIADDSARRKKPVLLTDAVSILERMRTLETPLLEEVRMAVVA